MKAPKPSKNPAKTQPRKPSGRPFAVGDDPRRAKFKPGNRGRPKGALNKATQAAQMLLDGEVEKLTRKCIELAMQGDTCALKLALDRIAPVRRARTPFESPPIKTTADVLKALAGVVAGVATGQLTTDEAAGISSVIETYRRTVETSTFEARLLALEASNAKRL